MTNTVGRETRWGYALIVDGYVKETWTLDAGPDSDEAMDKGTEMVLASGNEDAYYQVVGRVE